MAGKSGPETRLVKQMRSAGQAVYGERLVLVKYHGSQFGEAGVSDLLGTLDGVFVAIEAKSPHTSHGVTPKQQAFINRVLRAGGVAAVCDSVDGFLETLERAAWLGASLPNHGIKVVTNEPICTCLSNGVCDYLADPEEGCFYCRSADVTLPCPNNP